MTRIYLQIAELDAIHATEATELAEAVPAVLCKTYLWDPMEPIATRILAMSLFDETGAYQEDLYYTHDALKNTTALFGIKAGRRALYEYGPYGNTVKQEGDAAELNPFRFSSEYFDEETGLVQYNYRYYNPTDGRWISKDLLFEKGGINLYIHNKNGSIKFIDYLGLLFYTRISCSIAGQISKTKCRWVCQCPKNFKHTQYGQNPVYFEKQCCWEQLYDMCFCDPTKSNCKASRKKQKIYGNDGALIADPSLDSYRELQATPSPVSSSNDHNTDPWKIALGAGIIIATIVEDFATVGTGVADDVPTIGAGWALIIAGL